MKRKINKQAALAALLSIALLMGAATGCTKEEKKTEVTSTSTPVTLKLFSMTYQDDWTLNEENKYTDDRDCKAIIDLMDGDKSLVNLEVHAFGCIASSYRDILRNNGIDAYEMIKNNAYTKKNIGGIDMVETVDEERLYYLGRGESAGITIEIIANGDVSDSRVEEVISTINFTLPDEGNVDPPWPWDGERFSTDKEHTAIAADKTIKAEYIPFEEPLLANDIFSGKAELIGNSLWVLLDNKLREYSIGETLTFVKEVELPTNGYEILSSDDNGNLYVTGFAKPMLSIKDGTIVASYDGIDRAVIDKSGTFGISFFFNTVPGKVTFSNDTASVSEWSFIEEEKVNAAGLTKNCMYVTGMDPETGYITLWIYDKDGNLKTSLGNIQTPQTGSISTLSDLVETDSGFMALDGNASKLLLWKTDGTLIGEINDSDLFGTSSPWLSSANLGDDGSIYVGLTEARADKSANEFIVYKLSGF